MDRNRAAASSGSGPVATASSSVSPLPSSLSSSSSAFSSASTNSIFVGFCGCAITSGAFGSMNPTMHSGRRRVLGLQQRLGIRCLFVPRNTHVIDRIDDIFNLLRIHDLGGQVIVHLGISQVTLLIAAGNPKLELRLAILRNY